MGKTEIEIIVRGSAWIALLCGAVGVVGLRPGWAWRCGAIACVVHSAAAFQFIHGWSHAAAWTATASQVNAVTGWKSGDGLWANYVFSAMWVGMAVGWEHLSRRVQRVWECFFSFMAFNAAVVFTTGGARIAGCALSALTLLAWSWRRGAARREAGDKAGKGVGSKQAKI